MKTGCRRKWSNIALIFEILIFTSFASTAQITIGTIDAGPYTNGSTIAATFTIDNTICVSPGNEFQTYLSDASGSFNSEILIGKYTGFYSTYVNGLIPAGVPAGSGYKVRIKSTNPASISTTSSAFKIQAGIPITASISSTLLTPSNPETFGTCISKPNNTLFFANESSPNTTVSATVTDEGTGNKTTLNFVTPNQSFVAQQSHYTVLTTATMPDGTKGTKAYLIVNNRTITAFGTSGNNTVCLPMGFLEFNVDITSANGIQHNFPGDSYLITWGDQSSSLYTLCDIKNAGGVVKHPYIKSSCGSVSSTSSGIVYNAFDVSIKVMNDFCGDIGTPVSSYAKVVVKPVNSFSFNSPSCTNEAVTFTNTSILGENPNSNTPGCSPNLVTYTWYVDGALEAVNKPHSFNLVKTFTTHGTHIIRLESISTGACSADPVEMTICIQDKPKPAFTLSAATICSSATVKATDQSILDNICDAANTYQWVVSPAASFVNGTNESSKEPEFRFTSAGKYTVTLNITTPSCGVIASIPKTIIVNETPTATLSPNITLCNLATYDFNNTTSGPTNTQFTGTTEDLLDTYTWTIIPAGSGTYSFTGGTTINSKYPSIKFDSYDEYTVTVVHKNNCGTISKSQKVTFTTAPVINAGTDKSICYNETSFNLAGSIVGAVTSQSWIGGLGTFSPSRNDLNAVYTPTSQEKIDGIVTLRLRVTTILAAPCNQIDDDIILTIKPDISITSATSKSICTGNEVAYLPTNNVAGSTFTWVATATANASGFSASGAGEIKDVITNTDLINNATITYVITPHQDGCDGTPFSFVVTVTPKPIASATAAKALICNNQLAGITISSNLTNTSYIYSSVVTGSVTGNSNRVTASSDPIIYDILFNNGTSIGTVTYTITPISVSGCSGAIATITLSVLPNATLANAGPDESICNAVSYVLKGNNADVGTGKWTIVSAPNPITFADETKGNTTINGLQAGNIYVLRWTIGDGACANTSDDVQITVNPLSVGGTTNGDVNVCAGINAGNINLSGEIGVIVRWEKSIDNGTTWATIASTANPYVFTNLTLTTQFRAVIQSGICAEAISTISTITVSAGTVVANAGIDQTLCSGSGAILNGNNPSPNTGNWVLTSGQAGVTFSDASLFNTAVTGFVAGETYNFKWTISGSGPCPSSSSETTITYLPPVQNLITGLASPICAGQSITINGDLPTGGTGIFTYQWQNSIDGNSWSNLSSATSKDLTLAIATTTFYRRLVNSAVCTSTSNAVKVDVLLALTNNSILTDQTICEGASASTLTGSTPIGGNGTFIYQWQFSLDGVNYIDVAGATASDFSPLSPSETIFYRRSITSGCANLLSNEIKITVNLPAKAEIVFTKDKGCAPFNLDATNISATLYPDRNSTYTWFANNVQIGVGIKFPGYLLANNDETVVIKLVTTSSLGCANDEKTHTFFTQPDVKANYTQNAVSGCGPLNVTFTNTSNSLTAAAFKWDFGNGVTSNLAQPAAIVYQPDLTGKDITYTVTLEATTPCGVSTKTSTVFVKASPISVFSPDKTTGCSPFTVTFSNTSPNNSGTYTYDFGDGTTLTKTDKTSVTHTYTAVTVKNYIVKMVASNECGANESQYNIQVAPNSITPELVVNSNQIKGCAPFKVDFHNNTIGATTFVYDFGDGSTALTNTSPEIVSHTFTKGGKFTVTLYASNGCSNATTTEIIEVLDQPLVSFTADKTSGCEGVIVKFKNTSSNAIGYVWDFGDGTTSTDFEPSHTYTGAGVNYSVSLTATNILSCTNSAIQTGYINVLAPATAEFVVTPGNELSIPNYTFGFKDISIGVVSWEWNFGDGAVSTLQNPNHTYNKEGEYRVTLKVLNKGGCSSTIYQTVRIIGVPGFLNLPNSFMPASAVNELRTFKAKGRGISDWHMTIFNKWGQMLWETKQLDDGAPLEGWDGTFSGKEQPQGVYYWKIDVKFVNGGDWKGVTYDSSPPMKTGVIYLIR
ncbi:PKD domain-containing protein [Pedobacter mucosus]|uniref:PKD domain-containing protein n=1 Tax=Pedobacter mucosus TaxID=2895286 RepID=UPI001EE3D91E|nr:PKD domain-containing protein [Pedobacter mucosus]UKT63557.1 PKD domain-containing protein [Pedobacter mucosus]